MLDRHRLSPRNILLQGGAAATILTGLGFGLQSPASAAAPFKAGDIAVYRVGTGASLTSAGTSVFIDEYTPTGTFVQSIPLPTTTSGTNQPFVDSGTASSDGQLTLSTDGEDLVTEAYDASVGTAGVTGAASATVPRTVAVIDTSGDIDTSTALSDADSGNNVRSAVSTDGTSLWVAGGVDIRAASDGAGTSNLLAAQNTRNLQIADGQLYFSSSSGSFKGIGTVGTGTPKSGTQSLTLLPGNPDGGNSPVGFALATLGTGSAPDTLYVEDTSSILKYSLISGSWVAKGSITLPAIGSLSLEGLAVSVNNGTATLFASAGGGGATGGGTIWKATDDTGAGNTVSGSATSIITASTDEAFRGVAFVPAVPNDGATPEAPFAVLLPVVGLGALGIGGLIVARRRRRNDATASA
jgi:hypothetical protein